MQSFQQSATRKKILLWGAALIGSLTMYKLFSRTQKKEKVKMLSQDGQLVEIDKDLIIRSARKISDKELQQWVKNNPAQH